MDQKTYELRPYQKEAAAKVISTWEGGTKNTLLVLPTGCHAEGESLLMADGTIKKVENIKRGEKLLGADGKIRRVLHVTKGEGRLYKIIPSKGEPFIVTEDHQLTLVRTSEKKDPRYPSEKRAGEIIDVSVKEWLSWSESRRHLYKLVRSDAIEKFPGHKDEELALDPYFLGALLGSRSVRAALSITTKETEIADEMQRQAGVFGMDFAEASAGKTNVYTLIFGEKKAGKKAREPKNAKSSAEDLRRVPLSYKTADIKTRLELLAGIIDAAAAMSKGGYGLLTKSEGLAEDIAFICRSCGLAAYVKETTRRGISYWRVSISGECSRIPCRAEGKRAPERKQKKSVLRTGFTVEETGEGKYFGFTVDKDNRYLLSDFTVTHNCGKTVVFSSILKERTEGGKRAMVIAHRDELLEQAAEKIMSVCGVECAVEKAARSALENPAPIAVGSLQSMARKTRLEKYPHDAFDTIIIDEAHHAAADSYLRILKWFPAAKVLGVTATPDRAGKRKLDKVFDNICYEYTLSDAVRDGYLVPIKAVMAPLEINISKVKISKGDYILGDTGRALTPYLEKIAKEMVSYCKGRKTVVFLPLIETSLKFTAMLQRLGFRAAEIDGQSKNRKEILKDFADGKYDVLCNAMLLTEGWDCPSVDCIVVLRPTKSDVLYRQMVGRGMRLSPETGKKDLLLLDFLWLTATRSLVRTPASLAAEDEEEEKEIKKRIAKDGGDVFSIKRDIVAEREEALAKRLAENRRRKKRVVDPLKYAALAGEPSLSFYMPLTEKSAAPATRQQVAELDKCGIDGESMKSFGEAKAYLKNIEKRDELQLATQKQAEFLAKRGFRRTGAWTKEEAAAMIGLIQACRWSVPKFIDPEHFHPTKVNMDRIHIMLSDMKSRSGYSGSRAS